MYECLFENTDFLVINKFQGISFNNEQNASGLFSKLREDFGDLYAVHRLDKVTSGLLLIAKNKKSASELGLLFSSRNIEKASRVNFAQFTRLYNRNKIALVSAPRFE